MKQRITVEQLQELTEEQKVKLNYWWNPTFGDLYAYEGDNGLSEGLWDVVSTQNDMLMTNRTGFYPLLSIGQMIHFLNDHSSLISFLRYDDCNGERWNVKGTLYRREDRFYSHETIKEELCDGLWESVKVALKDEKK